MIKNSISRSCGERCAFGPFVLALARLAEGAEEPAYPRLTYKFDNELRTGASKNQLCVKSCGREDIRQYRKNICFRTDTPFFKNLRGNNCNIIYRQ